MATVEFIEKRIAGKEAEITKLEKKLERILKAKESNYEKNNPYYYSDYDLKCTTKDIEVAKSALEKYRSELATQVQKDNSRDVKVILDFLEMWKDRVYDFYMNSPAGLVAYFKDSDRIKEMYNKLNGMTYYSPEWQAYKEEVDAARAEFSRDCKGEYEDIPRDDPEWRNWKRTRKVAPGKYEWLKTYTDRCGSVSYAGEYLKKVLDEEAKRKYDDIIERTNQYVGQITDASGLVIGAKGDLNGIIVGTDGKAKVETIGAGGYNIQVFHFRTLIHPIKEK